MSEQARRWTNSLGIGLVILGLVIADQQLPLPVARPFLPGLILVGTGAALIVADAPLRVFLSGEMEDGGWSDLLFDMLLAAGGVLVATGGLAEWLWPGSVSSRLTAALGWGQLVACVGLLLVISAALHIVGTLEARRTGWAFLLDLFPLLVWGIILLLGAAATALGVLQMTAPNTVAAWLQNVIPPMPTPPLPGD